MRAARTTTLTVAVILVALAGYQFVTLQQRIKLIEAEQHAFKEKLE